MALLYPAREKKTRDTTPYLLTTGPTPLSITVFDATHAPGPQVTLPTPDLINTLRVPVEITELHFLTTESPTIVNFAGGIYAGGWEVSLAVGQHRITQGFVPLAALDVRRDSLPMEGNATWQADCSNQRRWIFPQPLILAPNEGFSGLARLSPNLIPYPAYAGNDAVATLVMVARGRRLPSGTLVPVKRDIPFASGWIFTQANTPGPDLIFENVLPDTIHVSSINVATTAWNTDGVGAPIAWPSGNITINGPGGLANTVLRGVVSASPVGPIVAERGAIEESHKLEPGEMYLITLSQPVPDNGNGFTAVNIVGWREE